MADNQSSSGTEPLEALTQPKVGRDILIVGSPIIGMALIGNLIGLSTLIGGAVINLGYLFMIFVGARLLQNQGRSWWDIGLKRPTSWLKTLFFGVMAFVGAVVLFAVVQGLVFGLLVVLGLAPLELDQTRFNPIEGNLPLFILMIALAWTTIAFGEELFYRAFLISHLVDFSRIRAGFSILIAGTIFGAVHFAEGFVGILANASFGFLFGWIYLRSSRNLWITLIGHGLINTFRFALLFVGAA